MSGIYFIGGAPRTGKTTVVEALLKQKPLLAASTDAIRSVAKGLVSPTANPRLHKVERGAFGSETHVTNMKNDPKLVLDQEIGEAEETWKSVLDFVSYYQQDGKDAVVEGVAILPSKLAKVDFDFKAVFIVNLSDQTNEILNHAQQSPNDWLNKYTDETIRLYASFIRLWNQFYADEAKKYGFAVIEIDPEVFQGSIDNTVSLLIGKV